MGKKQINCSVPIVDYNNFQIAYPKMLTHFVTMAIKRALRSKDFFNDVCFSMTYEEMQERFEVLKAKAKAYSGSEVF